jgi:hypothetical protein
MSAAVNECPEVSIDPGEVAQSVEQVPDQLKQEIAAARKSGATLAELKKTFGSQVHMDTMRELLPPMNAPEAKARTTRAKPKTVAQAAKSAKPVGGKAKSSEKTEPTAAAAEAKEQRYVDDAELTSRVLAARKLLGRAKLAEVVGASQSAIWRAENSRSYSSEVEALRLALKRIDAGEVEVPIREPRTKALSKADLTHRIDTIIEFVRAARGDKQVTKSGLIDGVLVLLDPPAEQPRQVCAVCGTGWPVGVQPPAHSTPGGEGPAGETHEFVLSPDAPKA